MDDKDNTFIDATDGSGDAYWSPKDSESKGPAVREGKHRGGRTPSLKADERRKKRRKMQRASRKKNR